MENKMRICDILNDLKLGNSVAESDERLDKYFINTPTYSALINGRKDIIAGDKGTGKTALYRIMVKRANTLDSLRSVKILTAFNPTGSPIFKALTNIDEQSEGQYIALWKTYFLALIGNWLVDQPRLLRSAQKNRIEYLLETTRLKTVDTSPKSVFSKLIRLFPKKGLKSFEMGMSFDEHGYPKLSPKLDFAGSEDEGRTEDNSRFLVSTTTQG